MAKQAMLPFFEVVYDGNDDLTKEILSISYLMAAKDQIYTPSKQLKNSEPLDKMMSISVKFRWGKTKKEGSLGHFVQVYLCGRTKRRWMYQQYPHADERSLFRDWNLYSQLDYDFSKYFICLEWSKNGRPVALGTFEVRGGKEYTMSERNDLYMAMSLLHRFFGRFTATTDIDYFTDKFIVEFKKRNGSGNGKLYGPNVDAVRYLAKMSNRIFVPAYYNDEEVELCLPDEKKRFDTVDDMKDFLT